MNVSRLLPGDVLLYSGTSLFSRIIKVKTGSRHSHVEVYDGRRYSLASRNGEGVARYPFRAEDWTMALRPDVYNTRQARAWFRDHADGQPYDWIGLMAHVIAKWQGKDNGRQFCSEFATRLLRAGGCDPFNGYDADGISPGDFAKASRLTVLWRADGLKEAA